MNCGNVFTQDTDKEQLHPTEEEQTNDQSRNPVRCCPEENQIDYQLDQSVNDTQGGQCEPDKNAQPNGYVRC